MGATAVVLELAAAAVKKKLKKKKKRDQNTLLLHGNLAREVGGAYLT